DDSGESSTGSFRIARPMTMDDDTELHEEIVRLESEIEQLAETIESCRKLILAAKLAAALAGALIVAALIGAINLDPAILIGAFGVVLGGVVVFGSNTSTLDQAVAATKAAELRRSELIGKIDLRLVGSPTIH
ncbi:MAG TPA: hypothetical protein VIY51_08330, partial [Xanthobacteraceae bacterium]